MRESRMSGSVGAGGGRPPSATRPHSGLVLGPLRARTPAARRYGGEPWAVRGRPRPHSGLVLGPLRARTPAHPGTAANLGRCADVLVRTPVWYWVHCGRGRPRTPARRRTLGGARTSSSAFGSGTGSIAGEDARAPRHGGEPWAVRGRPRPHSGLVLGPLRAWAVRGRPRPHSGLVLGPLRARTPAHPGTAVEPWAVRGRPRPHSGLVLGPLRARTPAHPGTAANLGRYADVLVRIRVWY